MCKTTSSKCKDFFKELEGTTLSALSQNEDTTVFESCARTLKWNLTCVMCKMLCLPCGCILLDSIISHVYMHICVTFACMPVCVCSLRLSHHASLLIRPDRCYYIEMRAVMYASVMWSCPLLLDGTWRFSLSWRVWEKNKVPTLSLKCGSWGPTECPKQIFMKTSS